MGHGFKTGGRQKGTPNKMTSVLKEAILQAAENAGNGSITDYLTLQASENPTAFMSLLGKVLPLSVGGDDEGDPIRVIQTIERAIVDPQN